MTDLIDSIITNPIPYAHSLGLTKLTENIHKEWIRRAFYMDKHETTQAHRGSYKSTCVRVGLGLRMIAKPFTNTIMVRKTDGDVKDIITAISKDLQSDVAQSLMYDIYGKYPKLVADSYSELELNIYCGVMGRQLLGLGLNTSITGKHGPVLTDDIVTLKDRVSTAERERTKSQYMELINIASESNQYIQNWGTPWHKDDAFTIMPKPEITTVYQSGIIPPEEIQERKNTMTPSLFAANYELKHIADGDVLFPEPKYGKFPLGSKAYAQIDAAYGGDDASALTIMAEVDKSIYAVGWKFKGHIDQWYNKIISIMERFQVLECDLENNADKGFLKKELEKRCNIKFNGYHERMNKYYKISTYGKSVWNRVILDLDVSDLEYIEEITDYNENSAHDDCPDSFASLVRRRFSKKVKRVRDNSADAIWNSFR
ncbi:MAG: hypothetical protein GY804_02625 [Alphaproteobacteria bacterium]|nr:hypothetical protein [Alphaproteobacteria bacterium]